MAFDHPVKFMDGVECRRGSRRVENQGNQPSVWGKIAQGRVNRTYFTYTQCQGPERANGFFSVGIIDGRLPTDKSTKVGNHTIVPGSQLSGDSTKV